MGGVTNFLADGTQKSDENNHRLTESLPDSPLLFLELGMVEEIQDNPYLLSGRCSALYVQRILVKRNEYFHNSSLISAFDSGIDQKV
jgi:hypothetical protein